MAVARDDPKNSTQPTSIGGEQTTPQGGSPCPMSYPGGLLCAHHHDGKVGWALEEGP